MVDKRPCIYNNSVFQCPQCLGRCRTRYRLRYHLRSQQLINGRYVCSKPPLDEAEIAAEEAANLRRARKARRVQEHAGCSASRQHCHSGCPSSCTEHSTGEGCSHQCGQGVGLTVAYRGSRLSMWSQNRMFAHMSTLRSVRLLQVAKQRGTPLMMPTTYRMLLSVTSLQQCWTA